MKIHIFHEDSQCIPEKCKDSAQQIFWENITKITCLDVNITFEIKGLYGNEKLRDYVSNYCYNDEDIYIILCDCVKDSDRVYQVYKDIKSNLVTKGNKNILLSNYLCFEYLLLKFGNFDKWIGNCCNNKKLLLVKDEFISCVDNQRRFWDSVLVSDYVDTNMTNDRDAGTLTYEKLAANLLSQITNQTKTEYKGGFLVNKTRIGRCWFESCSCNTDKDNYCKLNKTSSAKVQELYELTYAKLIFDYAMKKTFVRPNCIEFP